jgi:magnesium transporter
VASTIDRVLKNAAAVARAPDRLTYTLLDFLLENYGPPMDDLASEYAELETSMLTTSTKDFMSRVLQLKGELQKLRQIVRPQRDVVARLARGEFKIVRAHMLPYYRDLLDQLVRMTDFAENYRDALNHTLEVYAAVQQMEINRVVKVLTVLGALAIPVLVITSFYGMNVKHMPNTEWPEWYWAYAWIFGVTALSTGAMYWFMRRRGW